MNREATVKPGTRLYSPHTTCEIVVVRPPSSQVELTCDGRPMLTDQALRAVDPDVAAAEPATRIGKRYVHPSTGLEVLCTKGGAGRLAVGDEPLELLEARALPSSD